MNSELTSELVALNKAQQISINATQLLTVQLLLEIARMDPTARTRISENLKAIAEQFAADPIPHEAALVALRWSSGNQ